MLLNNKNIMDSLFPISLFKMYYRNIHLISLKRKVPPSPGLRARLGLAKSQAEPWRAGFARLGPAGLGLMRAGLGRLRA